ncbi:hypothetical protein C8R45DRAFT_93083 [Mycena sanguinolenta]|nr:hypothetical protein C8R45DRAFT_93083 [Mycena sanguinolenta]
MHKFTLTSMGPLPQELVDTIVGLVAETQSIIACALTARSFVEAGQRRIFRLLSIQDIFAYELLAGVLTESPHLGQYVKLLSLRIVDIPARWAALESILSTTTRVERLMIEGDREGFVIRIAYLRRPGETRGCTRVRRNHVAHYLRRGWTIRNQHRPQRGGSRVLASKIPGPFDVASGCHRLRWSDGSPHPPSSTDCPTVPHAPLLWRVPHA